MGAPGDRGRHRRHRRLGRGDQRRPLVYLTNSNDATKIRYYTPSFGGFGVGVDYTPTQEDLNSGANNGSSFAFKDGDLAMDAKNIVEGGLVWARSSAAPRSWPRWWACTAS